jgi:hypothetical protein
VSIGGKSPCVRDKGSPHSSRSKTPPWFSAMTRHNLSPNTRCFQVPPTGKCHFPNCLDPQNVVLRKDLAARFRRMYRRSKCHQFHRRRDHRGSWPGLYSYLDTRLFEHGYLDVTIWRRLRFEHDWNDRNWHSEYRVVYLVSRDIIAIWLGLHPRNRRLGRLEPQLQPLLFHHRRFQFLCGDDERG